MQYYVENTSPSSFDGPFLRTSLKISPLLHNIIHALASTGLIRCLLASYPPESEEDKTWGSVPASCGRLPQTRCDEHKSLTFLKPNLLHLISDRIYPYIHTFIHTAAAVLFCSEAVRSRVQFLLQSRLGTLVLLFAAFSCADDSQSNRWQS